MLNIDKKRIKALEQTVSIGEFLNRGEKGYNLNIKLRFFNLDTYEKGYINLDVGFEKEDSINAFANRKYKGKPFDDDNQFIYIEVYDTEKFLDSEIESTIEIELKSVKDDKIEASFKVDDEMIKIAFEGLLDIDTTSTKEAFR